MLAPHDEGGQRMIGAIETVPDLGQAVAIWRPEPEAFAALDEMRRRGLAVAAGALVLALALALVTARHVTRPILHLVAQARLIGARRWREIALGDALRGAARQDRRAHDFSLGRMAQDLEQGEADIAREAKLARRSRPVHGQGRRRRDRAGRALRSPSAASGRPCRCSSPTSSASRRSPSRATPSGWSPSSASLFSDAHRDRVPARGHGRQVHRRLCHGRLGRPLIAQEDHARRALAAAEDMMRFLETANEEWRERYDVEVRLGVGVNSGEAIVGNIGSDKRMEYTVIGDVVNVASRLEAIAAPNQVLVSEATRNLAGDAFRCARWASATLTGRKTTTAVYALDPD